LSLGEDLEDFLPASGGKETAIPVDKDNPKGYDGLKHYVFAFHDSTFECIARGFNAVIVTGLEELILDQMRARIIAKSKDPLQ